ncbi:hypothetical protein ACX80U_01895 [Arthrobacter sp. TmT3-37]
MNHSGGWRGFHSVRWLTNVRIRIDIRRWKKTSISVQFRDEADLIAVHVREFEELDDILNPPQLADPEPEFFEPHVLFGGIFDADVDGQTLAPSELWSQRKLKPERAEVEFHETVERHLRGLPKLES